MKPYPDLRVCQIVFCPRSIHRHLMAKDVPLGHAAGRLRSGRVAKWAELVAADTHRTLSRII